MASIIYRPPVRLFSRQCGPKRSISDGAAVLPCPEERNAFRSGLHDRRKRANHTPKVVVLGGRPRLAERRPPARSMRGAGTRGWVSKRRRAAQPW
jgi:hypothetical protein